MTARLTPKELHKSGLLYHVNETVLWPLGLALAVDVDPVTGEYQPGLEMIDFGEVIQDPDPEIRARANEYLAERFRTVRP